MVCTGFITFIKRSTSAVFKSEDTTPRPVIGAPISATLLTTNVKQVVTSTPITSATTPPVAQGGNRAGFPVRKMPPPHPPITGSEFARRAWDYQIVRTESGPDSDEFRVLLQKDALAMLEGRIPQRNDIIEPEVIEALERMFRRDRSDRPAGPVESIIVMDK